MTKQEAIKNAYGEAWEKVAAYVDENGWCKDVPINSPTSILYLTYKSYSHARVILYKNTLDWRPASLDGIEDNNGWIRFEDEEPDREGRCWYCLQGIPQQDILTGCFLINVVFRSMIKPTHWKPYVEPKSPLY